MKIILTDAKTVTQGDLSLEPLNKFGEVVINQLTNFDDIAKTVKDANAIICNKTILNRETLKLSNNLKYIGLFATGFNNIDLSYCNEKHITVCNAGSYSTYAVAQHTFALILEFMNKVGNYNKFVQEGNWQRSITFSPFVFGINELYNKTLGIFGYGAIGKAVAKIGKAFGMNVICHSRSGKSDENSEYVDFDTLIKQSDILTVHCPLNSESEHIFNRNVFNKMKKTAIFINTARGGVLVEDDLVSALNNGEIKGAGIDVLEIEPMDKSCTLMQAQNCVITPHIAWAPMETRERLMGIVADNLDNFLKGTPKNVVNNP